MRVADLFRADPPRAAGPLNRLAAGLAGGAAAAGVAYSLSRLARTHPGGRRWQRSNHAGRSVTLLEGPAAVAGAITGVLVRNGVQRDHHRSGRRREIAELVAIGGAAAVGAYDDLFGSVAAKGFRGHLRSLRRGVITSGMIKIAGIGLSGLAAAVIERNRGGGVTGQLVDIMINTTLTAGTANLINLFDLRPGRAAKVIIGIGALTGAAPTVGAAVGILPDDLAGRSMLGDCGANALGAGLGVTAGRLPRPLRLLALAGVVGLTVASEKISFTEVIEHNRVLSRLDLLGRPLPSGPAAHGTAVDGPADGPAPGGTAPDVSGSANGNDHGG